MSKQPLAPADESHSAPETLSEAAQTPYVINARDHTHLPGWRSCSSRCHSSCSSRASRIVVHPSRLGNTGPTPDVTASVFLVWFLMEGAGVISAVSFFLTGAAVSAAAMMLATAVFWMNGPSTFAK